MFTERANSIRTNPVCSALEKGISGAISALNRNIEWLREKYSSNKSEIVMVRNVISISSFAFIVLTDSQLLGPAFPLSQKFPTAFKIFKLITKRIVDQRNWFDSYFPKDCTWNIKLSKDNINISTLFIGALQEELIFRILIQNVFFKSILKIAPQKIQPLIAHRVTRIWIASTIFALIHVNYWDKPIGPIPQIFEGFLYGYIFEKWNFTASTATHLTYNLLVSFFLK